MGLRHDGVIIKTTNGGGAWIPMSSGTTDNLFNSSFVNSNTGWIAGDNGIIKTTNGGNSWISQLSNPWAYSVYFVDANTGYAGFRFGKIFKTTNSGLIGRNKIVQPEQLTIPWYFPMLIMVL